MKIQLSMALCVALSIACSKDAMKADLNATPVEQASPAPDPSAPATAGVCGTRGGVQCSASEFCDYGGDALCGATDKGGHCKSVPTACTRIYLPTCGCDSRTYGNECEAHSHGASVKHEGMCTPEECQGAGGTVKYSNGADTPKCDAGQDEWSLSGGKEGVICCLSKT